MIVNIFLRICNLIDSSHLPAIILLCRLICNIEQSCLRNFVFFYSFISYVYFNCAYHCAHMRNIYFLTVLKFLICFFFIFILILGQCIAIIYPSAPSIMQLYIYIVILCSVRYACLVNE